MKKSGYTLTELLVVVAIAGILAAILVPSWLTFSGRFAASKARDSVHAAIIQAKSEAKLRKEKRQVHVRQQGKYIEVAVSAVGSEPVVWRTIGAATIDPRSTFYRDPLGRYRFQVDDLGQASGQLGRLVVRSGGSVYCVFSSTIVGALRTAEDRRCL